MEAREEIERASATSPAADESLDMREARRRIAAAQHEFHNNGDQVVVDHEAHMAAMYAKVSAVRAETEVLGATSRPISTGRGSIRP